MTSVRTANLGLVQKINRSIVLSIIRDRGPLSRADISRRTKLTRSTVSSIVSYLTRKNLVKEIGLSSSGVGRRGILLKLNPKAYYVVGVDLGTLNTIAAVVDLEGKIVERVEHPTNGEKNRDDVIERVKVAIREVITSSDVNLQKIAGIGLAVPGLVDSKSGGVAQAGGLIFDPLKRTMKKRAFPVPAKAVKIVTPSLGRNCTVIGAATLVLKDIFKSAKVVSS